MPPATEDRISLLSDDLIHHILSFIPSTKFHSQTSILSKRWRHLWAHHPNLHFSIPNLDETMDPIPVSYIRSVDRRLNTFNPPFLNSFTIDLFDYDTADRWLTFAAGRSARKLTVQSRKKRKRNELFRIPGSLFHCLPITDLTVQYLNFVDVPHKFHCFPNLKILNFVYTEFCIVALTDFLARCPVLERLEFVSCTGVARLKITTRNLRNLTHLGLVDTPLKEELSVNAPNLRAICFEKSTIGKFTWKDSCSVLTEAKLAGFDNFDQWTELVRSVSNVTVLKVDVCFFQFGNPSPRTCYDRPKFPKLKYLTCDIDWISSNMLVGLTDFIGDCPILEKLFINFNCGKRISAIDKANVIGYWGIKPLLKYIEDDHERDTLNISNVFNYHSYHLDWASHHLKTITMKEFLGTKNEMQLIESLLGRAPALEELIVHDFLNRENLQLEKVFAAVPRASSGVQLIFHD